MVLSFEFYLPTDIGRLIQCTAMQLNKINKTHMEIGSSLSTAKIFEELIRQLELLNRVNGRPILVTLAVKDMKICQNEHSGLHSLRSAYGRYRRFLPPKAQNINLERVQRSIFFTG